MIHYLRISPMSIRWRLPLSYAAIALIAAFALGAVLLTTLRSYYDHIEWEYLHNNAAAIQDVVGLLRENDVEPEMINAQLKNIAFLLRVRVEVFDQVRNLLVDTGNPQDNILSFAEAPDVVRLRSGEFEARIPNGDRQSRMWVFAAPHSQQLGYTPTFAVTTVVEQAEAQQDYLMPAIPDAATPYSLAVPARWSLFGLNLNSDSTMSDEQQSSQSVEIPVPAENGGGMVRLSLGPAYGLEILNGVARAWFASSVVAVILAALVGLYMSHYIAAPLLSLTRATARMSHGDLSARAAVESRDEVGLLARSFNEMANRVEETIFALRRFVADAAHELHTPLTALRTNIELVTDANRADEQRLFVERALAQVNRLETLTGDLLELSRLEANGDKNASGTINLSAAIRDISELYASQAEQANIQFQAYLPPDDIRARANESQIRRAVCNLLENAIKFTPSGGTICISLERRAQSIELAVQDTGIGIPDDDLPQLFSRFHRGRNAFSYPGSGLGLAIVKAIADAHAGAVRAEQHKPGTRLILRLPASPTPE